MERKFKPDKTALNKVSKQKVSLEMLSIMEKILVKPACHLIGIEQIERQTRSQNR